MKTEPERCVALDARGFLPGTSAMRLLTEINFWQSADAPGQWVAQTARPIDVIRDGRPASTLTGSGDDPAAAMAALWAQATSGATLAVYYSRAGDPLLVWWDPERGWATPVEVAS